MSASDIDVLERWRAERDASAFNEIVTNHSAMVYATCRRILGNTADAEDLTQECFLRLSRDDDRITESLGGWLHTLATRRSISQLRSEKSRKGREERYAAAASSAEEPTWDDVQAYVDECIAELPQELSDLVIAHFLERRTQQDIASTSGISKSAISRRIEKGVAEIRAALKKRGVSLTSALLTTLLSTETTLATPAALSASLGKIAIVGAKAGVASNALLLGGSIVTKQIALFTVAAIVVIAGALLTFQGEEEPPSSISKEVGGADDNVPVTTAAIQTPEITADQQPPSNEAADSSVVSQETSITAENPEPAEPEAVAPRSDAGLGNLVIAGVVNDESGDPIKGVFVQAFGGGGNPRTNTDATGSFRLVGLAQGLYSIGFHGQRHTTESLAGIRAGEENLIVVLRGRAAVSGTVVNAATGAAVTQFEIQAVEGIHGKLARPNFGGFATVNDPQGHFHVDNVQLGDSTLVVRARGYATVFEPLRLETREPIDEVTIALQPGLVAQGRVLNEVGETVSGAWIFKEPIPAAMMLDSLNSEISPNPERFIDEYSDVEGRFAIDTLTVENRTLAAFHPDHGYGDVALMWKGSRLSGLDIVLSESATGAVEVVVTTGGVPGEDSVVWVSAAAGGMGDMLQQGRTDSDGKCRLDGIPLGTWGITAVYPGQIGTWLRRIVIDCEVVAGQTTVVAVDFQAASASLNATVTLDGESPLGGHARLTLTRPGESETYMYIATWGDDGTFAIADIMPGAGSLMLMAVFSENRMRTKNFDLEIVENEQKVIEIDLSGGQTLTGVMYGLATTEHGTVAVLRGEHEIDEITLETISEILPLAAGLGEVAADGSYSVEGLDPGLYTILAMVTRTRNTFDAVRWSTTVVEISDGEESTVDLDMR